MGWGAAVGYGVFVGLGVAVGHWRSSWGWGRLRSQRLSPPLWRQSPSLASRVAMTPASTVAGTSGVGGDAVCVSAGDGVSLVQATAARPKIAKTTRMTILIFFLQCCEDFQSFLSMGSAAVAAEPIKLPGRRHSREP